MSTTFSQHYNTLFIDELNLLYARTGPQLRNIVQVRDTSGNNVVTFKTLGSGVATTKNRGAQATFMNLTRGNVTATPSDIYAAELIAEPDELRSGTPDRAAVMQRIVEALGRAWDDDLITTLSGTGTTPIAHGSAGLTLAKILETQEYFLDNNVPIGEVAWIIGPQQLTNMETSIDEFKSIDYANNKAFERADLTSFMFKGMPFVVFNQLPISSTTRSCFAVARSAVGAILPKEINTSMDKRVDLINEWQLSGWMSHGSTLIQEPGVIEVQCTES